MAAALAADSEGSTSASAQPDASEALQSYVVLAAPSAASDAASSESFLAWLKGAPVARERVFAEAARELDGGPAYAAVTPAPEAPGVRPPPLPITVRDSAITDPDPPRDERTESKPTLQSEPPRRNSAPSLAALAGPAVTARTRSRPPPANHPLSIERIAATPAATISLSPPALSVPPSPLPRRGGSTDASAAPPRKFAMGSAALGFIAGSLVTGLTLRLMLAASSHPSPAAPAQSVVCHESTAAPATSPAPLAVSTAVPGAPTTPAAPFELRPNDIAYTPPAAPELSAISATPTAAPASATSESATSRANTIAHPSPGDGPVAAPAHATRTAPVDPPATEAPRVDRATCARQCSGDADCLIACARHAPPTPVAPNAAVADEDPPLATPPRSLHATPTHDEVVEAMSAVREAIVDCVSGENNPAHATDVGVTVTFASSGRATIAIVAAPFAGTPAGSCVARAARAAELPPFAQPTFRVVYPFAL